MPSALITGITGQDGSYLAELLLSKGYLVHGLVRRTSSLERSRLQHLYTNPDIYGRTLQLHYCDLEDATTLRRIVTRIGPDELYHLAGQSHVGLSFEITESTVDSVAVGTLRLLEIIRDLPRPPRVFHAASSEIFGRPSTVPQDEETAMAPVNPYGASKAFATQMCRIYREKYGLHITNGILYNHESPRRGENFVTRKICRAAASIKLGLQRELSLGDTSARRDWGDARDYVRGMWQAVQHTVPEDFVFATGVLHSVQDVVEAAFSEAGLDLQKYVRRDERLLRGPEPFALVGNPAKAERILHWKRETDFAGLIRWMLHAELQDLERRKS
ncbi:MAG: GDP-mannose 4,6-dehydratase [Verrucomicrobia bacterium]|nr:GDP-mannose 4,6-dehydratase [Verrucomicrobiota bacterium]